MSQTISQMSFIILELLINVVIEVLSFELAWIVTLWDINDGLIEALITGGTIDPKKLNFARIGSN